MGVALGWPEGAVEGGPRGRVWSSPRLSPQDCTFFTRKEIMRSVRGTRPPAAGGRLSFRWPSLRQCPRVTC